MYVIVNLFDVQAYGQEDEEAELGLSAAEKILDVGSGVGTVDKVIDPQSCEQQPDAVFVQVSGPPPSFSCLPSSVFRTLVFGDPTIRRWNEKALPKYLNYTDLARMAATGDKIEQLEKRIREMEETIKVGVTTEAPEETIKKADPAVAEQKEDITEEDAKNVSETTTNPDNSGYGEKKQDLNLFLRGKNETVAHFTLRDVWTYIRGNIGSKNVFLY